VVRERHDRGARRRHYSGLFIVIAKDAVFGLVQNWNATSGGNSLRVEEFSWLALDDQRIAA